ncbi:site-specific recombinase XerD [Saccharopolyspora lacisalsi]|uniref:Site-specific recombinase XerD n=1 Tax=Halosaccharopolyspora lacisalsi TaxID=1000566 RepID=A0A839E958_9PSEU|nr:tyrosine-type recombinase/integrase [Halosaccharopolyspora lacisalsi]MBA8827801.1 site-specific recombinase XerD [Halosaccharopolyspora lacisalsi]
MEQLPESQRSNGVLQAANSDDRYNPHGLTDLWLQTLARKSANTCKLYERALSSWLTYCHGQNVHPFEARRADVDDWLLSLGPKSASTLNSYQSGVRNWYRYLGRNGATEADPVGAENRSPVDRDVSNTASLDQEEMSRLLDYASKHADETGTETAVRNCAMLRLMLTTGVRSAAVLASTVGQIQINRGHRVLEYRNKGGKRRQVPLAPYVTVTLDRYHQIRADRHGIRRDELSGLLFVSAPYRGPTKTGDRQLDSKDLGEILRRYARKAGIESHDQLVPHSTRHSVITNALAQGISLPKVQDLAGHADPRMTRLYDHSRNRLDDSPAYQMAAFISEHSNYHPQRD